MAGADGRATDHIVVVGGGAGGLELAIRLSRRVASAGRARITLVDARATHIWKPRYHEIAAGLMVASDEEASYASLAERHGFEFVMGRVASLDPAARRVRIDAVAFPEDDKVAAGDGDLLPPRELEFDRAVIAIGSTVNDFGTPGVERHCYTLDDPGSADRLHHALLARALRVKAGLQDTLKVVIVGAGSSGVELAAELRNAANRLAQYRSLIAPEHLEITLVEMGERPLPHSPESVSDYARNLLAEHGVAMRFGAKVVEVDAASVTLEGGETLAADVAVWVSGIRPSPLAATLVGVRRDKGGRLATDPTLRVLDEAGRPLDSLYALGDVAAAPLDAEGGTVPATAQAAHQEAALLARSLARQLHGRPPLAFRYRYKGTLVSLGEGRAVGDLPRASGRGELQISGLGAKLAYAALYEGHLAELFGPWRTAGLALSGLLRRSARPAVKLYW